MLPFSLLFKSAVQQNHLMLIVTRCNQAVILSRVTNVFGSKSCDWSPQRLFEFEKNRFSSRLHATSPTSEFCLCQEQLRYNIPISKANLRSNFIQASLGQDNSNESDSLKLLSSGLYGLFDYHLLTNVVYL